MRSALVTALLSAATALVATPSFAHHSFAAFEEVKTRTLEGTVNTFQWANPHVMLTIMTNVEGRGRPQVWTIVTSGPSILKRFGWRRDSMKAGDRVSLICNAMRDGSPGCRLHTLTLLDSGQVLKTKLSTSNDPTS
jgi:uncharacterized protein DUF6152